MKKTLCFILVFYINFGISQPKPGDIFKEYVWVPTIENNEKFLRVGGHLDYAKVDSKDCNILLDHHLSLEAAIKAELVLEKVGSHAGTTGLRIMINDHQPIAIPDASGIPKPQEQYMHHYNAIVPIPLELLNEGAQNTFKLEVDSTHSWNWPQNLIYGITFRIYYPSDEMEHTNELYLNNSVDSIENRLNLRISGDKKNIQSVDYLGWYDGPNFEGDGVYEQWHYHLHRGKITHHIGSSNSHPYDFDWDFSWIPDQSQPIKLAARVRDQEGMIYFTKAVDYVIPQRDYGIELCKPFDQPRDWVTRNSEFSEKIQIKGNLSKAVEAKLLWTSWSSCYANGIFINDIEVFSSEGPCYEYMFHEVNIKDLSVLKSGQNSISTGHLQKLNGVNIHGMEVQWPGIMLLVKYKN